ncbi:hypothetical protein NP493_3398g00003 [Ridgeia piscesae]|uniref:PKD domain-containing protein n=1 Tax=Ridgeia piscesae TaxID=27915 RepID=A0AAD9MXA9_RIDPI|nr:hypothetical protein NP493_3398g00003 [Ridgeia piscesae]
MTINMMDADTGELLASQWAAAPEYLTQTNHTFLDTKRYTLFFNVSNDVSDANVTLTFDVDVPVTGATAVITAARPHEECTLNVIIEGGTRPQFYVMWDTEFSAALTNESYFVSRHNYSVIGIHEVSISVQNSVSMSNFTVDAYVSYDIADLTLSQVDYSDEPTFRNVTFLSTISNGTHVTTVTTFGDDFFTVMYHDDPPLINRFSHEYDAVGDYNVTVESFNHISSMSKTITLTVNVAIVGFSVDLPDKVITGQPFDITFSVEHGNPVTFKILKTTKTVEKSASALPVASNETTVPAHKITFLINSPGSIDLQATAENTIKGEVDTYTKFVSVDVYDVISDLSVAMEDKKVPYAKTGEEIKLIVSLTSGSRVGVSCDFGDRTQPETKLYGTREAGGKTLEYTHTYARAGNYSPSCNASNIYSADVFDFDTVVIQNELPAIILLLSASIVAVPDGAVTYTVELTDMVKLPTNPFCNWTFADGSKRIVYAGVKMVFQNSLLIIGNNGIQSTSYRLTTISLHKAVKRYLRVGGQLHDQHDGVERRQRGRPNDRHTDSTRGIPERNPCTGGLATIKIKGTENVPDWKETLRQYDAELLESDQSSRVGDVHRRANARVWRFDYRERNNVALSSIAWFTANTLHGTDITYILDYGDETKASEKSGLISDTPVEFTHSYATVGNYSVRLNAFNNVSGDRANLDSLVIVQNRISKPDIKLTQTHKILSTDDPIVTFTLDVASGRAKPTDVHVTLTFPGIAVIKHFVGTVWPAEIQCNFNHIRAGDANGNITLTNLVGSETLSASIQLQERIRGLVVTGPKVAKVGETVVITVTLDSGSHMVGNVDFGDGTEEIIPKDSITRHFNLTHTYTIADTYSVSVRLKNTLGSVTEYSDTFKVQTSVGGLTLEGDDIVKIPEGVLHLKIVRTTGEPASTPLTIDATYSPETEDRLRTQSLLDTDIELTHTYGRAGDYAVKVNVSNDVGSQILSKNISVYEDITELTLSVSESDDKMPVTTSITHRELTFSVDYRSGTNVWSLFKFGDGVTDETGHKSVTHKYTQPGNYDVKVTATNPVQTDGVTAMMQLKMLAPLGIETFAFNDTVTFNTSAPFSVEMNGKRDEICFEFKFTDDAGATTTLWRGTPRSVCERATDFMTKTFREISVPTGGVDLPYVFPRVSVYDIRVTVLTVIEPDVVFHGTVTATEKVLLCSNPVVTVKTEGDSPSNPIVTRRSAGIELSSINFDITNLKKDASVVLNWEMFEHDIDTNTDTPKTMSDYGVEQGTNTIGISPHTLPYGLYKFTLTVELIGFEICFGSGDVFVSIVKTPLDVNIKYGALRLVGSNKPVEMNAADLSNDPDVKEGGSDGMVFEWYCRKEKEEDARSTVVVMPVVVTKDSRQHEASHTLKVANSEPPPVLIE